MNIIKKYYQRIKSRAGFTMIELLIVIAILGVLTIAVLSAINPIEQINRGRDTGSKSDLEQLIGAMDRFYTHNGYYPWVADADEDFDIAWTQVLDTWQDTSTPTCGVLAKLGSGDANCDGADELKEAFINRITKTGATDIYVYNRGDRGDSTYVCFSPKSSAFLEEAKERCENVAGDGLPADLQDAAAQICVDGDEYICLP